MFNGKKMVLKSKIKVFFVFFQAQGSRFFFLNFICNIFFKRMFHIDDVPSGAGDGITDLKKIKAVSKFMLFTKE